MRKNYPIQKNTRPYFAYTSTREFLILSTIYVMNLAEVVCRVKRLKNKKRRDQAQRIEILARTRTVRVATKIKVKSSREKLAFNTVRDSHVHDRRSTSRDPAEREVDSSAV